MPLSLPEIMRVSPFLAEYVEAMATEFSAEMEKSARMRKIGPLLAGTKRDSRGERRRLGILLARVDAMIEPRIPELVSFLREYADPPPRKRAVELWPGGGLEVTTEPLDDADVVVSAWNARSGATYEDPKISITTTCSDVGRRIPDYKAVKRESDLQSAAERMSNLTHAVANRARAADQEMALAGMGALLFATRDLTSRQEQFDNVTSVLEAMI